MFVIRFTVYFLSGLTGPPLAMYFFFWVGRVLVNLCHVIVSTFNFILHGTYQSSFSYFDIFDAHTADLVRNTIWFPETPLLGLNKIAEFLQFSFFSTKDALLVFWWSLGIFIFTIIIGTFSDVDDIDNSPIYYLGIVVSIIFFYPAFIITIYTPITAIILYFS